MNDVDYLFKTRTIGGWMIPNIDAQARDLNINLNDSCNCCCFGWRKRTNPNTQVYITKDGEVVRFNRRLSADMDSLRKCNDNLLKILTEMADQRSQDMDELREAIESKVMILHPDIPRPITLENIQKIKDVVNSVRMSPTKTSREHSAESGDL